MATQSGGFWRDFSNFAVKGNALDLAIAVVVGNAFSAIVNGLVSDIITPLLGLLTGNVDFKSLTFAINSGVVIQYGAFFQTIINFFIISLSIFAVFKFVSVMRERLWRRGAVKQTPPAQKPDDVRLLEEIRDLLKGGKKASM
jgi:large conductance mechanosensitive channel